MDLSHLFLKLLRSGIFVIIHGLITKGVSLLLIRFLCKHNQVCKEVRVFLRRFGRTSLRSRVAYAMEDLCFHIVLCCFRFTVGIGTISSTMGSSFLNVRFKVWTS